MKITIIVPLIFTLLSVTISSSAQLVNKRESYQQQCQNNKVFLIKNSFSTQCSQSFHHYNSKEFNSVSRSTKISMASFNLWHPGQRKSIYKDYRLMAKMINQWDLLAAQELQASVGPDLENNRAVIKFLRETPQKIADLKLKLSIITAPKERERLKQKLKTLTQDLKQAPKLYRAPGYLKLLFALRKLDPSWSLLLASQGEAAQVGNVAELTGFYYRSSKLRPTVNSYCSLIHPQVASEHAVACTVQYDGKFLSHPYKQFFSRRPFISSFVVRRTGEAFDVLTSHLVFNPPRDPQLKHDMLQQVFNVESIEELGQGAYPTNFARLAELKMIMLFLQHYHRTYPAKNIFFSGDFNLELSNPLVQKIVQQTGQEQWQMLISSKTSLKQNRFNRRGEATHGVASNYDHFIVLQDNNFCTSTEQSQARPYNFLKEQFIKRKIDRKYKIRIEKKGEDGFYKISKARQRKAKKLWNSFKTRWQKRQTIKNGKIAIDTYRATKTILGFKRRVLDSQLRDQSYYRFYNEIMSDHLPIVMSCRAN